MNQRRILNIISQFIGLIGMIGFLAGFFISAGSIDYENELPLGDVSNIALDSNENIYVSLQFYGKVQCYDKDGNFVRNWSVKNGGGSFKLRIKDNVIQVATARGDYFTEYDLEGNEITSVHKDMYSKLHENNTVIGKDNIEYYISNGLFPDIYKKVNGRNEKVARENFLLYLFQGPMFAWLLIAIATISSLLLNKDRMLGKKTGISKGKQLDKYKSINRNSIFSNTVKYKIPSESSINSYSENDLLDVIKKNIEVWDTGSIKISESVLYYHNTDDSQRNISRFKLNDLFSSTPDWIEKGEYRIIGNDRNRVIELLFYEKLFTIEIFKKITSFFFGIFILLLFFNVLDNLYLAVLIFSTYLGLILLTAYFIPYLRCYFMIKKMMVRESLKK